MRLNKLYENILKYAKLNVDKDGYVYSKDPSNPKNDYPITIKGKRLALPLDSSLRENNSNIVFFHPLRENIMNTESEVVKKLADTINCRLNFSLLEICSALLTLAANHELHKNLTPEQTELLLALPEVDMLSQSTFVDLANAGLKKDPFGFITKIYLRKGAVVKKVKYGRVGVVVFVLYNKLVENDLEEYNVKIRQKDLLAFKNLMTYIFPGADTPEDYYYGSNSLVAPFIDALMRSSANIAGRINELIELFKDYIPEPERSMFDSAWTEEFEDLDSLIPEIQRIPMQRGNEGESRITERMTTNAQSMHAAMQEKEVPLVVPYSESVNSGYVAPVESNSGLKMTEKGLDYSQTVLNKQMRPASQPYHNQPQPGYPPNQPQIGYPPPGYPQPGYPPYQPPVEYNQYAAALTGGTNMSPPRGYYVPPTGQPPYGSPPNGYYPPNPRAGYR